MTRCVTEPVREVPVAYETDVLVLGADLHPEHIFIGGKEL